MKGDIISPRSIGVVIVALLGVTILASISAPAVQATNDEALSGPAVEASDDTSISGPAVEATNGTGMTAQQGGVPDCTRCHSSSRRPDVGVKGQGLKPKLCAECHQEKYEEWKGSGHEASLSEGSAATQIRFNEECGACHKEADIKRRDDIDFQTKEIEVGKQDEPITCEACHAPPSNGWFDHFGQGGDMLEPEGVGPHGSGSASVSSPETVCTACHSNRVVLQLANESKISPHSTELVGDVGDDTGDGVTPTTTTTTTTETPTETTSAPVPGFGVVVALFAVFGGTLLVRRFN